MRRIEQIDADLTFKVGLIYGPSGCGKSSLVKAGLLPRLGKHVLPVYIEATPEETEARLLKGLRKACPELSRGMGLVDSLANLRRGRVLPPERKVLLVLDQFEQWLHAKRGGENTELVATLRHCDGEHVQAVVLVRDDFWLAASRFMRDLEIDLVPDQNIALIDLFDPRHARKVLTAFGQAYGTLSEKMNDLSKDQQTFLDQAITELAQDDKVISVRLALFAEMVKGKPWSPATLREVGGTEGVGVTFLLDRAPTAHDGAGGSPAWSQGTGSVTPDRPGDPGRDRGVRKPAGRGAGRVAQDRQHDACPGSHRTTQELPPLGQSSTPGIVVEYRER